MFSHTQFCLVLRSKFPSLHYSVNSCKQIGFLPNTHSSAHFWWSSPITRFFVFFSFLSFYFYFTFFAFFFTYLFGWFTFLMYSNLVPSYGSREKDHIVGDHNYSHNFPISVNTPLFITVEMNDTATIRLYNEYHKENSRFE